MEQLFKDMASGAPIIFVVMGCVQWVKVTFNTKEPWTNIVSMLIGLAFGGGYLYGVNKPHDYMTWFAVVVYGVGLGLIASGVFKVGVQMAKKAAITALDNATPLPVVVVDNVSAGPPAGSVSPAAKFPPEVPARLSELLAARERDARARSDPTTHQ